MANLKKIIKEIDIEKDYTVKEIADMGIGYNCVYNAIRNGIFPERKIFGKLYVCGDVLKKYLIEGTKSV